MGCGTSFVKYVLFFFNLLFALVGLGMLGAGVAIKLKVGEMQHLLEGLNSMKMAPTLLIIIGAIIFVIAFFGCCGAVRESHCMVVTYAVMLLIIIILQVVLAVIAFIYVPDTRVAVTRVLNDAFKEAQRDDSNPTRQAFSVMEQQLSCCGTEGPSSYGILANLPTSCCANRPPVCIYGTGAYTNGCIEVLTDYLKYGARTLGGVAIGVAVVEIVGAIFALCLANSIRNMDRRSHY